MEMRNIEYFSARLTMKEKERERERAQELRSDTGSREEMLKFGHTTNPAFYYLARY